MLTALKALFSPAPPGPPPAPGINPELHAQNLNIFSRIQERVGGEIKTNRRGVPHLAVGDFAVIRFGNKKLRVFGGDEHWDFCMWEEVSNFLEDVCETRLAP